MRRVRFLTAVVAALAAMLLAAATASAASGTQLYPKNATEQGYGGVGGQIHQPHVAGGVNGVSRGAPLATAGRSATLPFTGAQLGVFLAIGLALVVGGLLLHRTGRGRSRA